MNESDKSMLYHNSGNTILKKGVIGKHGFPDIEVLLRSLLNLNSGRPSNRPHYYNNYSAR